MVADSKSTDLIRNFVLMGLEHKEQEEIYKEVLEKHADTPAAFLAAQSLVQLKGRQAENVHAVAELDALLPNAEIVILIVPSTDDTRRLIGAKQFALMQPHAFFITTARGFIHDERALYDALKEKRIAGAGLDVWDKEPPPPEHPLLQFDNVLASPHTAGVTKEARVNMGRIAAEQLLDALDGKRPPRIINPEVWPVYTKRFAATFGVVPK